MKPFAMIAATLCTIACASTPPETPAPVAPAQVQTANADLKIYEGTYEMQGPRRTIELRVWLGQDGKLNGELVGLGQQTVFRPTDTAHKFLHATRDDVWFLFTVAEGRASSLTMHQAGREISGQRSK